jgi:transcriptional regulator with XRE-family HTH domain
MSSIGNRIVQSRKLKGLTQEELASMAKLNLRTIQRIESGRNTPRESTLKFICEILELDSKEFQPQMRHWNTRIESALKFVFLVIANFLVVSVFGFLTIDTEANFNSRLAAVLLGVFIPMFIVFFSRGLNRIERFFYFGAGPILYLIAVLIVAGLPQTIVTGIGPAIVLALVVLYYGDKLLEL